MRRKVFSLMLLFAVLLMVIGGCAPKQEPSATQPAQPDQAAPSGDQSGQPGQTNEGPNIVVVTMDSDIDDLDPHNFKSDAGYISVDAIYDTFVQFPLVEQDGALVGDTESGWIPGVAEAVLAEDGKSLTIKARPGVTFHNGNPVNAEAIRYSFERMLKGPGYAMLLLNLIGISDPAQVQVVDEMTVTITMEKPSLMLPKVLPLALNVVMDPATGKQNGTADDPYASKWHKTNAVGTGPYLMNKWTPGVEYSLKPNANYWDKAAIKNDGILVKVVPAAEERFALLKRGAVDVALGIPPKELDSLKGDPDITLYPFPSRNTNYLVLNNELPPFDNKLVRQAVAHAVPYQTLIDKVLYGFGQPLRSVVPEGMPTHKPVYDYQQDAAKARDLLVQAGYPNGFDVQLAVSLSRTEDQQVAVWLQSSLKEIGINVEVTKLPDAQYREKQANNELPMFIEYWYSWANDPIYQLHWLLNSNVRLPTTAHYKNPRVDQLIEAAMWEYDPVTREQLSQEIQEIVAEDVPYVLLYQRDYVIAARKNVTGVNNLPDQHLRFNTLSKK